MPWRIQEVVMWLECIGLVREIDYGKLWIALLFFWAYCIFFSYRRASYHYIKKKKNGKRAHTKSHQHTPLGFRAYCISQECWFFFCTLFAMHGLKFKKLYLLLIACHLQLWPHVVFHNTILWRYLGG